MAEQEKELTEKESLDLITEMINKAKHCFHESGTSAILWGSAVGIAGLVNFAELYWNFRIGFDIWLIVLAAIIPQIFITIREGKRRQVITHTEAAVDAAWLAYTISMFALVFYFNIVPGITDKILERDQISLVGVAVDGSSQNLHYFIPSQGSLLLLLYAIPTMATGIAHKFRAMFWGSVLCYVFFIISCFTSNAYDMLLNGLAGIFNWLIPGLILKRRFWKHQRQLNV